MGDAKLLVIETDGGERFVEAASFVAWLRDQARRVGTQRLLTSREVFDACAAAVEAAVLTGEPLDPSVFFDR